MDNFQLAAWGVVVALSMMMVGGLVLWAYGGAHDRYYISVTRGLEAEAARRFHNHLARWFFIYGVAIIGFGILLLIWAVTVLM